MPLVSLRVSGAFLLAAVSCGIAAVSADTPAVKRLDRNTVRVEGVRIFAAAYFDRGGGHPVSSRYAVQIESKPAGPLHWDLCNPLWEMGSAGGDQGIIGEESTTPYRYRQHHALVTCRLRQYDELEEKVTFHDLTLSRGMGFIGSPGFGFLMVTKPQTATTSSGIIVTLPVQNAATFMPGGVFVYNGPPGVVFARVRLSPGENRNVLPTSPLWQRHHVPVSIRLGVAAPVFMNSNSGSSSWPQITLTLPDPKATHLDSLTLIVHQRADLQSVPLAFRVPITQQAPEKLFADFGG